MALCTSETGRGGIFDTLPCAGGELSEEYVLYQKYRGDIEDIERNDHHKYMIETGGPSKDLIDFIDNLYERDMQRLRG